LRDDRSLYHEVTESTESTESTEDTKRIFLSVIFAIFVSSCLRDEFAS